MKLKLPPLPPSTEDSLVAQLADAKWVPANKLEPKMPPGAEVALIGADPVSTGPTTYVRMKPGYKEPMHWHVHLETSIMVEGKGRSSSAAARFRRRPARSWWWRRKCRTPSPATAAPRACSSCGAAGRPISTSSPSSVIICA